MPTIPALPHLIPAAPSDTSRPIHPFRPAPLRNQTRDQTACSQSPTQRLFNRYHHAAIHHLAVLAMAHSKDINRLNLDDMLPELPFSNIEGGSQKSYLGAPRPTQDPSEGHPPCLEPSQPRPTPGVPRVVKVFHENPTTESQLAASGGPGRPFGSTPGTASGNANLRAIAIEYLLFNRTTTNQIAQVLPGNSKSSAVTPNKEWEKVTPYFDTVWKAALEVWSWPNAQQCITTLLGEGRPNLDKHIRALEEAGLLKWQCILANHGTYGSGKLYYVYSDEDFSPFVAAMVLKPKSKVTIKILMADPRRSAKDKEAEKSQNDSLAMAYGSDDERLALQKVQTRLAVNPKCDTESAARTRHIVEITEKILEAYGGDAESMRIKDPADPLRSMRITRKALFDWSRALVHKANGVTSEIPPRTDNFVSENITVYTLAEQHSKAGCRGNPGGSARPTGGKGTGPQFTSARVTSTGRVRPPRLESWVDAEGKERTHDWGSVPVTPHQARASLTPQDNQGTRRAELPEEMITPGWGAGGYGGDYGRGGDRPDSIADESIRDSSTDLEVISRPPSLAGLDRSPARKIPRSPGGEGIAHTISRLNFNPHRPPRGYDSTSPTRKLAGSHGSSSVTSAAAGVTSSALGSATQSIMGRSALSPLLPLNRDRPPLNAAGRALSMEEFLGQCNFRADDMVPRVLVNLTHIRHWDFFYRDTDVVQLQHMGFPYPIAAQLINGAESLGMTHTTAKPVAPDDSSDPGPAAAEADDEEPAEYQPSPEY
ncbi:hypothetical protein PGTUg99_008689 [Puccinia graminis f. sp. tritici]|uniref:Uncharacterized protein n=1 Tax=Puccinia graminis f. sp. tritici TaxID=56615 RepID=A0A5B0SFN0_PUCGR|nr:hypothetical protein PGTUg99_008689 [Puccinia graminis f. sp. tritici]